MYKILFKFKDNATGQEYTFTGIKEGQTPQEAEYYFLRQYPRHEINIIKVTKI